jgi:hypothetical protein
MNCNDQITEDHAASHLTDKQRLAVDCIVQGLTDHQVAKEIGAARETVCRWRKNNPAFIAVLNQRRMALWHASKDRMRRNIALALDVLETALKAGDVRVALEFVKRADKDVPPIGPETIEGVIDEMARDQAFQGYRSSGHAHTVEALRYEMGFGSR